MTEWNASDYSRQSSLQEAMAGQILALLDLGGAERVLDVGCGDGKITARIAGRVPRGSVLGVDPSRDMIAFASGHFPPSVRIEPPLRGRRRPPPALPGRVRPRRLLQRPALGARAGGRPPLDPLRAATRGQGDLAIRPAGGAKEPRRRDRGRAANRRAGPTTSGDSSDPIRIPPPRNIAPWPSGTGSAWTTSASRMRRGISGRERPSPPSAAPPSSRGRATSPRTGGIGSSTKSWIVINPWRRTARRRRIPSSSTRWMWH